MAKDLKIGVIEAKDETSFAEIIEAFAGQFNNPKIVGEDGKETEQFQFTPEGLVKHHINNFIRGVVSQHRQSQKRKEIEQTGEVSKDFVKA